MKIRDISNDQLIEAYSRLGSVWRVADEFGLRGQSVHRRLKRANVRMGNPISEIDRETIAEHYRTADIHGVDLRSLAKKLGRTKAFICRSASEMGLTDPSRPRYVGLRGPIPDALREKMKVAAQGKWTRHQHPRGMAGKKHTDETKYLVSEASKKYWATAKAFGIGLMSPESLEKKAAMMTKRVRSMKTFTRARGGRRDDIGPVWFRSSWEANYARYLNLMKRLGVVVSWEYEPHTFWFDGVKRGVVSYLPDFRVIYKNDPVPEYVEIKGWVQAKDRVKWRRMGKYHPHIKLIIIKEKEYRALSLKWSSSIPNWESSRGGGLKTGPRKPKIQVAA